jgi:hypothetical protein
MSAANPHELGTYDESVGRLGQSSQEWSRYPIVFIMTSLVIWRAHIVNTLALQHQDAHNSL